MATRCPASSVVTLDIKWGAGSLRWWSAWRPRPFWPRIHDAVCIASVTGTVARLRSYHCSLFMSALMQLDDAPLCRSLDLALAPHEGYVFVDTLACGGQVVTHTISHERRVLPREFHWDIVFGQDGFAALVGRSRLDPSADERIDLVESMLTYSVYQCGHDLFISARGDAKQLVHVSAFAQKFTEAVIDIKLGSTGASHRFDCSIFKRPRQGAKLFLSCKSIYEQLSFTMFSRAPWRWAWVGSKRWVPWLDSLGLCSHFAFSNQAADARI